MVCSICSDDSITHNKRTCQFRDLGPGYYKWTKESIVKKLAEQAYQRQVYNNYRQEYSSKFKTLIGVHTAYKNNTNVDTLEEPLLDT
jgi:hypothetical protein